MPKINAQRVLDDLRKLRTFGGVDTGVVRPALSEADIESRYWLKDRYADAGLDASIDGVANVFGRSRNEVPALIIGSHSDTQPQGGWLDGALGVIYGLEIARACAEDPATAHLAVDAVSWQDEESNFIGCLGSRSWCGTLDPAAAARRRDGRRVPVAARRHGRVRAIATAPGAAAVFLGRGRRRGGAPEGRARRRRGRAPLPAGRVAARGRVPRRGARPLRARKW